MQSSSDAEARPRIVEGNVLPWSSGSEPRPRSLGAGALRSLRFLLGVLALLVGVAVLARSLRPELEHVGQSFVDRFGLVGMAFGSFLADGFHFPVPPQFYMLLSIASKSDPRSTLACITLGSLAGGTAGFFLARRLSRIGFVARWLERSSKILARFSGEKGFRILLVASFTPIAFSALCYVAGFYRLPKRYYAIFALIRVPKLVAYYYLVKLGWGFGFD